MYSIMEKKGVALGLLEQVLLGEKKISWNFFMHLKKIGNQPGETFSCNPLTSSCGLELGP